MLFEIDPRPYQAEVDRTEATLAQAEAHSNRLEADYHRAETLLAREQLGPRQYDLIGRRLLRVGRPWSASPRLSSTSPS